MKDFLRFPVDPRKKMIEANLFKVFGDHDAKDSLHTIAQLRKSILWSAGTLLNPTKGPGPTAGFKTVVQKGQ